MEAQIPPQHGDEQLPTCLPPVIQGEDVGQPEHDHHEKKSVLKNVKDKAKAKAKKIKETLKHGHGHEHDHDHHSPDEEDYDDEELVEDPEVHGAPIYESDPVVRSGVGAGKQLGVNLEKPYVMAEDRYDTITDPPTKPFSRWEQEKSGQGQFGSVERVRDENKENPGVKIGNPTPMEEDLNAPRDALEPSNYQSKVADPIGSGAKEAGATPILRAFDKMSVYDEPHQLPKHDPHKMFTGSHDQFSPEPIPENAPVGSKDPGFVSEAFDSNGRQSGYMDKISSATSVLTGKAIEAKNIIASKLGYGEKGHELSNAGRGEQSGGVTATAADYGHRAAATVTETLAPVTEKVANVGSSVLSKVKGGSSEQAGENKGPSKGVKEYLAEKLRPSEDDKALSEVISDTLHRRKPQAEDKPVTVSDEVARQLGTGSGTDARVGDNVSPAAVETVKGWFGIGQSPSSHPSQSNTNAGNEQFSSSVGSGDERTLQHTAN